MERIGVYVLLCSNGRYYVGSSNNLLRRLSQHKGGYVKATKYVLPVVLRAFIECETAAKAKQLEYKIKKSKSRKVVENHIMSISKNSIPINPLLWREQG